MVLGFTVVARLHGVALAGIHVSDNQSDGTAAERPHDLLRTP